MEDFLDLSNKLNWSLWRAIAHFDFFLLLNTLTLQDSSARSDSKFIVRMLTMFMAKCESDDISDNRDYDVLPNLASLEGSTLYDMTSFGPRRGVCCNNSHFFQYTYKLICCFLIYYRKNGFWTLLSLIYVSWIQHNGKREKSYLPKRYGSCS